MISKEGYVLTSKHVFSNTGVTYQVTLSDGKTYAVDKVRFDDALDLAVLKIAGSGDNFPVAHFISFTQPAQIGQFVLALGSPASEALSVTFGILSSTNKTFTINTTNTYVGLYQTDALLVAGNSGGPLLDLQGQVLGINTAVDTSQGRAFALPVSQEFIATTLASLATYSQIVRPLLGLQYKDITPTLQKDKNLPVSAGVIVTDVLA
ncbi:MAG: S1C family serine protease [bacterium]